MQGVPLDKFVEGCRVLMDFVGEVEALVPGQLAVIDIGGPYTRPGQMAPNLALTNFYRLDSESFLHFNSKTVFVFDENKTKMLEHAKL